ncbi:MAG: sulfatase-like hydrolase/transferase [Paludibacteraceae bacterium]
MKKINHLPLVLSGTSLMAMTVANQVVAAEKPNVVVVVADDLGTNELGCYGGTNLHTPNIDRIAHEGVRFTNHFASSAMSVPIRASLYTGLYPARHGSYQNHKASYNNLKSVAHYLSDLGYRVGRTGKDHPVNQPNVYAFEKINGFTVDCVSATANYTTDGITEFIQRNNSEPFCLFVCSIHPHMPWTWGDASKFNPANVNLPPNCVDDATTRSEFCKYLAEIQELDNEVGSVMDVLTQSGQLDHTLVIFLGEQGPQMPFGKWTCYNYGQHSAMIARYPSKISQGSVTDALVQYEDILPTMIEFAGGDAIPGLDGNSFLDVLYGNDTGCRQWAYGMHNNIPEGTSYPIRSIQDKKYKLIVNLTPGAQYYEKHMMTPDNAGSMWNSWLSTAQTNDYASFLTNRFVNRPAVELYDLETDKWELTNLVTLPEHAQRIALMRAELERWMEAQGDRGVMMDTADPEDPSLKSPQPISSIEDIDQYMRNDLSGNYYLTNNIEMPESVEWIPIGATSILDGDPQRFRGIFDGKGYSIKNLKISTQSGFKGLFGRLFHAKVRDFDLVDVNISGLAPTGGIAGAMIGESIIERVSVTGNITGGSEIGGIVGRIARDPTYPDYNLIHDCYVNANIKATKRTTDMSTPSVAGGIAAFSHSTSGGASGKIDIRRCYVAGSVISQENTSVAGNASGILTFYDNHNFVKMEEVIVLCDTIGAATSNLFFSRRGPTYDQFELFYKVYARTGIALNYLNSNDRGRGGEIPEGIIRYFPAETYKTKQFYDKNLTWDFLHTWAINEGKYPKLKRDTLNTSVQLKKTDPPYKIYTHSGYVDVRLNGIFAVSMVDLTGKIVQSVKSALDQVIIPADQGFYILKLVESGIEYAEKVMVL